MGRGVIPAGSETFVELVWHENPMPALYNDDAIHAFRIRMSEELRVLDLAKVNDLTLKRLLDMGCFDWKVSSRYFSRSFFARFHNLVTTRSFISFTFLLLSLFSTLLSRYRLAILTNDSHELL